MEEQVPFVDAHHHLWDLGHHRYDWLQVEPPPRLVCGDISPIRRDYLVEDFLRDASGQALTGSVHLQADRYGHPAEESRWLQGLHDQTGFPSVAVAYAHLEDPDVNAVLEEHAKVPIIRGIRQILNWHEDEVLRFNPRRDLILDDAWRRGFALLERFGFSFDLQLYPDQMHDAARLAGEFPDVQIMLNHAGMPIDQTADGRAAWRAGMDALAANSNVAVKLSGLVMIDWNWTTERLRPWILDSIAIFGADRCMFGSNFPVDKLHATYPDLLNAFRSIVADFSVTDRHALFHANAERLYRL